MTWFPETEDRRGRTGAGGPAGGAGFTLIELLVALAVLGFALVLVTGYKPSWSGRVGVQGTAAEIASALRLARSEAIAENRPVVFGVDLVSRRYRIGSAEPRPLPPDVSIELLTIAGERQSAGASGIRFHPDGSSTGGRITIGGARRRLAVGVDWLTGRVAVADVR